MAQVQDTEPGLEPRRLVARWLDPLVEQRADPRIATVLLAAAMLVSLVYCLWAARGTTFSGDELYWVAISPDQTLRGVFEPHSGHLVAVPHFAYKVVLETVGPEYVIFRLMTLAAVFTAVGLLFAYARRRVGAWLALAPCLVLLFLGTDAGHLLQGNGFTIMTSIACGMLALVALERGTRGGDAVACLALSLGVLTYSEALPFVAGAGVIIFMSRGARSRIWVPAIPLLIYASWRIWLVAADVEVFRGGVRPQHLALLPAWTFQSLSGVLSALTGVHWNFGGGGWLPPGEMAGPVLAAGFVAAVGWRIPRAPLTRWFWAAMTIALAYFAMQVVTWIPAVREPGTSRYILPGAFIVLLVTIEAVRGATVGRSAFVAVWLVALTGFATNVEIIASAGKTLRTRATAVRAEATAATLLTSAGRFVPGPGAKPLASLVSDGPTALIGAAERRYGGLGLDTGELQTAPPASRAKVDSILAQALGLTLQPEAGAPAPSNCEAGAVAANQATAALPAGGATLRSRTGGAVSVRRFGDAFSLPVGSLRPGTSQRLVIPVDENPTPWRVAVSGRSLLVCR